MEIGPSYRPTFAKADGWNTFIIDTSSKIELVQKYRTDLNITETMLDSIESVDYVWNGRDDWDKVIGGSFDWVVACHVIEHQLDMIGFLNQIARMVVRQGFLFLAIPNKNLMFDYYRRESDFTDVLAAHLFPDAHNFKSRIDEILFTCLLDGRNAWAEDYAEKKRSLNQLPSIINSQKDIKSSVESIMKNPLETKYVDRHRWAFTPSTFQNLLLELLEHGLCDWQVVEFASGEDCEFLVVLKKL